MGVGWATGRLVSSQLAVSLCHTSNLPTALSSPSLGSLPLPQLLFGRDPEPFDLRTLSFEQLLGQMWVWNSCGVELSFGKATPRAGCCDPHED